jgi:segregation and condensation protein A
MEPQEALATPEVASTEAGFDTLPATDFTVLIKGQPLATMPVDLYIPPDALEIFLDAFQGPLDLLLYLIRKHNLDILDIPIAEVTRQYVEYVELMKVIKLELAAEYLVMAALLAEIKSRMLLPRQVTEEGIEEDPRAELARRLQEYEQYKQAAEDLDKLPRLERDWFAAKVSPGESTQRIALPDVQLPELLNALREVMQRADLITSHQIQREGLSVRERMAEVLARISKDDFINFVQLFPLHEGRMGVVVTLLALLELAKEGLIEIVQTENYAPIHIRVMN